MNLKYRLFAPGPVSIPPCAQEMLAKPMLHHRSEAFVKVLKKVREQLQCFFGTSERVFILSSTGSGAMEAGLINLMAPQDTCMVVRSGKFGERWSEMAKVYGGDVIDLDVEWGKSLSTDDLITALEQNPDTKILMSQACETSTGALHPIQEMAKICRDKEILFLVDAITALGTFPIPMDEWGIDVLIGGSQKAFMLPTGASFLSLSKKAQKKMHENPQQRFYFDLRKEEKAYDNGEALFSSSVSHIRALEAVLTEIFENDIQVFFDSIKQKSELFLQLFQEMNLEVFPENPAPALSVFKVPQNIDGNKLRKHYEEKYQIVFMGGQDQLKGKIIRIGHMGHQPDDDLIAACELLAQGLADFGYDYSPAKAKAFAEEFLKEKHV